MVTSGDQTASTRSSDERQRAVSALENGADGQTRTDDLLITNQLLYQLSYVGQAGRDRNAAEKGF